MEVEHHDRDVRRRERGLESRPVIDDTNLVAGADKTCLHPRSEHEVGD
jgi:hypothetical protein